MERAREEEIYVNSEKLGIIGNIYHKYWRLVGESGPEIDLVRDPIRINIAAGAIVFPNHRLIDRWGDFFGEELKNKIQVINKWKYGCQAFILGTDSPAVDSILKRIHQSVLNEKELRVPKLTQEQREVFEKGYAIYLQNTKVLSEKDQENTLKNKPLYKELLSLKDRVNAKHDELLNIKEVFEKSVKEMKEFLQKQNGTKITENKLNKGVFAELDQIAFENRDWGYYDKDMEKEDDPASKRTKRKRNKKEINGNEKVINELYEKMDLKRQRIFGLKEEGPVPERSTEINEEKEPEYEEHEIGEGRDRDIDLENGFDIGY